MKCAASVFPQPSPLSIFCTSIFEAHSEVQVGTLYTVSTSYMCPSISSKLVLTSLKVTFAAASVLITATLSPSLDNDVGLPESDDWWEEACNIFDYNTMQSESVSRGLKVLKKLYQNVSTLKARGGTFRCHCKVYLDSLVK